MKRRVQPVRRILAAPAVISVATIGGLIAGLMGDGGAWDALAAASLVVPVLPGCLLWRRGQAAARIASPSSTSGSLSASTPVSRAASSAASAAASSAPMPKRAATSGA